MSQQKEAAVALRKKGTSYGEIGKRLGVAKSTLSYWLKGVSIAEHHRKRLYTNRLKNMVFGSKSVKEKRMREIEAIVAAAKKETVSSFSLETRRLFGAALYWAEGSKDGALQITNSDPMLILFMTRWFREIFGISPKSLRAWLNIYSHQNETELVRFWSSLCGIPVFRFGKSFVKPSSKGVKKNTLYYGTIKIRAPKSTNLKHKVFGWIEGALQEYSVRSNWVQRKWRRLRIEKPVNMH